MKINQLWPFFPLVILILHFILIALYLAPINPLSYRYQALVSNYVEPLFTQNWALFAPEPATSMIEMHVRCGKNDNFSQWKNPLTPIIDAHQKTRIFYHGRLLYLMYGPLRNFHNALLVGKNVDNQTAPKELSELLPIKKIAILICGKEARFESEFEHAQIRIWQKFPPQFSTVAKGLKPNPTIQLVYQSEPFPLINDKNRA